MKRLITLFLLLAMLISCFALASCGDKKGAGSNDGGASSSDAGDNKNPDASYDPTSLDIPSDVKYEGTFKILTYKANVPEFYTSDNTKPDAVESSLKERDMFVSARLGVDIEYQIEKGGFGDHEDFADKARANIQAGQQAYDLIGAYSLIPANLALNDVLVDMNTTKYIDFDKVWYPEFMVDVCTINDQTYFITGDLSASSMYRMLGVAFDPTLAASKLNVTDTALYQMVYDGDWTYENLFTMCKDAGERLTSATADDWNAEDFYPIRTTDSCSLDGFFHGASLNTIVEEDDGTVAIQNDLLGDTCQALYKMVMDAKQINHSFYDEQDPSPILNKKCVFAMTPLNNFRLSYSNSSTALGVLPYPKWTAGTDVSYKTWVASHYQYCIPNDVDDPDRSAAVLEALGYGGYTYVVPTLFTKTMKLQYSPNVDASNMFDIMRDTRVYSVSAAFYMTYHAYDKEDADGGCIFRYAVQNNRPVEGWTSDYHSVYEPSLTLLEGILNDFYNS